MQFGPYIIQKELARGGQGAVYLAHHQTLHTPVAIKVLLDPEPRSIKRFKQEARILSKLKHPHLLQVLDLGEVGFRPYLAMEYIEGFDLKEMFSRQGAPAFNWLLETFDILAEVCDYIHSHGLTHRDIKPANIFFEEQTGRVILVDFGLVKRDPNTMSLGSLDKSRLSLTGEMAGTPAFMAPEQADASFGDIGPWTDFYALGSTMYYLLTGHAPFEGSTSYNILVKLMQSAPPDPRTYDGDIPPHLAALTLQCMEKDPALRPQSGSEFAALLRPPYKPRSKRKLHKIGAAILALSGLGGLIHYLTDQGYSPIEAEQIAENIMETEQPAVVESRTLPQPSIQPIQRVETLEELLAIVKDMPESDRNRVPHINRIIELYPDFYRGYLYRASTFYQLNKTEPDIVIRRQNRAQISNDIRRAISLCPEETEKQKLEEVLQRFEVEAR